MCNNNNVNVDQYENQNKLLKLKKSKTAHEN